MKNVLLHIKKAEKCKTRISDQKLNELEKRLANIRKEKNTEKLKKWRKEKLEKMDKKEILRSQNNCKASSRIRLRDGNYEEVNEREKGYKADSRKRKREENEEKAKDDQRKWKANSRKRIGNSALVRLSKFREDTMYGPLFICISCHGQMFRHSVQEFTDQVMKQINGRIPLKSVIADMNVLTRIVTEYPHNPWSSYNKKKKDDIGTRYICSYCVSYLRSGNMPPTCAMNSLQLHDTDSYLKNQDLWLTELEASLISTNLIFHKIFPLPRSRWTGLTGKVVNVPITSETINQTLVQLPKTPASAGLISLTFKRMKDMKNHHKKQLINPEKIFRVLQRLKENQSPYHQNLLTPDEFKNECQRSDENGYQLIYGKDDLEYKMDANDYGEVIDNIEDEFTNEISRDMDETIDDEDIISILNNETHENREAEKNRDGEEILEEDPVKKYHFEYYKSLCMMDKYPEITLAPGEGHKPKGMLGDKHWDVKAFPHLHNADGSNGKDQDR